MALRYQEARYEVPKFIVDICFAAKLSRVNTCLPQDSKLHIEFMAVARQQWRLQKVYFSLL